MEVEMSVDRKWNQPSVYLCAHSEFTQYYSDSYTLYTLANKTILLIMQLLCLRSHHLCTWPRIRGSLAAEYLHLMSTFTT